MEVNLLTYTFEIVNFFLVLFILQKILYKPVISTLKRRKEYVEKNIKEAEEAKQRYENLKKEYESIFEKLEEIKNEKMAEIVKDVEQEKEKLYRKMKRELEEERRRFFETLNVYKREVLKEIKDTSVKTSVELVSKMLNRFADKNLHKKLIDFLLEEIKSLKQDEKKRIIESIKNSPYIRIETAYKLDEKELEKIKKSMEEIFGINSIRVKQEIRRNLKAGIKIHLESNLIDMSLSGQLSALEEHLRRKLDGV